MLPVVSREEWNVWGLAWASLIKSSRFNVQGSTYPVERPTFLLPRVLRLCRNPRDLIDLVLSLGKAQDKHREAFSSCYESEILRLGSE
jgi:hypothetical protein